MKTNRYIVPVMILLFVASCKPAGDKTAELTSLKSQRDALNTKIAALESAIAQADTTQKNKVPVVSVGVLSPSIFRNYVEIQGRIDADENISLSSQIGGAITKINVKVGDEVTKGEILAETDSKVIVQTIAEVKNAYDLAQVMYDKQKNLWDQKIGTEVQFLSAKNQKESLERKLASLQQQLDLSHITSSINGTVDAVDVRLGQMTAPGMQAIRVVNFENLKVKGDVSEAFSGKIKKGDAVDIIFPDLGDTLQGHIDFAAKVISALNRTFTVQVNLDRSKDYHPNMIAILKIVDYVNTKALVVPINTIQHAQEGDFIIVAENNKARKIKIKTGHLYNGNAEVTEGLKEGDKIILNGFQELNEGEQVAF